MVASKLGVPLGHSMQAQHAGRADALSPCALASRRAHHRRDQRLPGVYHMHPTGVAARREQVAETEQAGSIHQQPSTSPLAPVPPANSLFADFSTRIALERLYQLREAGGQRVLAAGAGGGHAGPGPLPPLAVTTQPQKTKNSERTPDYFANMGDAIRTLREDIPELFNRELNYSIYRDDVVFKDPRNKFEGLKNYKLIFWSLRFHGRIFFSSLYVEVKRIWQPSDDVIKMRWTVHGVPRVPWEAEGLFDGVSTYKLDNSGKVYEHAVDNVLLRDPPMLTNPPLLAGLNLVPGTPQQAPYPGAWGMAGAVAAQMPATSDLCNMPEEATAHAASGVVPQVTRGGQPTGWQGAPSGLVSSSRTPPITLVLPFAPPNVCLDGHGQGEEAAGVPGLSLFDLSSSLQGLPIPGVCGNEGGTAGASRSPDATTVSAPVSAPSSAAPSDTGRGEGAGVWLRFSWVRLYAALLASVCVLGGGGPGFSGLGLGASPSPSS